jgi:hypothetical protein
MEQCLKLNEAYQNHYRATKDKLASTPKGRQFEFAEDQVTVATVVVRSSGRPGVMVVLSPLCSDFRKV